MLSAGRVEHSDGVAVTHSNDPALYLLRCGGKRKSDRYNREQEAGRV
jgi:hypothetical protein